MENRNNFKNTLTYFINHKIWRTYVKEGNVLFNDALKIFNFMVIWLSNI